MLVPAADLGRCNTQGAGFANDDQRSKCSWLVKVANSPPFFFNALFVPFTKGGFRYCCYHSYITGIFLVLLSAMSHPPHPHHLCVLVSICQRSHLSTSSYSCTRHVRGCLKDLLTLLLIVGDGGFFVLYYTLLLLI